MSLNVWLGDARPRYLALLQRLSANDLAGDERKAAYAAMQQMRRVANARGIVLEQFGQWGFAAIAVEEDDGRINMRAPRGLVVGFDLPDEQDDMLALQAGARAAMDDLKGMLTKDDAA